MAGPPGTSSPPGTRSPARTSGAAASCRKGREFAASSADAIFSRHGTRAEGQAFYADVKGRLAKYGRTPDQLLILPAATFVLGDTDAEAAELARQVRRQQVSGPTAIAFLEQLWNRDLSGYDPDGPLPDVDPDPGEHTIARGRASVRMYRDPLAIAAQWRAKATAEKLSIRELIIEVTGRQMFVGSPATIAGAINDLVQADASDGFILVPHITPSGLDEFAGTVVPRPRPLRWPPEAARTGPHRPVKEGEHQDAERPADPGAIAFPAPAQARAHTWTAADRELVADRVDTQFVGSAGQVAGQLGQLRDATGADELIITTITHDHADRVRSYQLLAEEWRRC